VNQKSGSYLFEISMPTSTTGHAQLEKNKLHYGLLSQTRQYKNQASQEFV
jgi:hypothetical protein